MPETIQPLGPNQERWLSELESGKWEQCHEAQTRGNARCCLAVANELFDQDGKCYLEIEERFAWNGSMSVATLHAATALALRSDCGMSSTGLNPPALIELNDGQHKTFAEIAAIVRSDPSVYFTEPR